jgi:hypothetical protein
MKGADKWAKTKKVQFRIQDQSDDGRSNERKDHRHNRYELICQFVECIYDWSHFECVSDEEYLYVIYPIIPGRLEL